MPESVVQERGKKGYGCEYVRVEKKKKGYVPQCRGEPHDWGKKEKGGGDIPFF